MPLDHAILAVLTGGPLHGHALARRLGRLLYGIRTVNPGQVYATLARLARDGSIAQVDDDTRVGARHANGVRTYALLPAGASALRRWLDRPVGCAQRSDPFAQQLALLVAAHDVPGIARALAGHRTRCVALRAVLEQREKARGPAPDLLAGAARRHLEAELAWLADAARCLLESPPAAGPGQERASERADMDADPD